jgi:NhaA family Na+:H+ antiporter
MATDIAFAVGVLALLGERVPHSLKVMLLSLAIVDDIGAITVIAVFYTDSIDVPWLLAAVAGLALVAAMRRVRIWYTPAYAAVGTAIWACTWASGVHATIAGVALGLLCPARPLLPPLEADQVADRLSTDVDVTAEDVRAISFELRESVSVGERLEEQLHPWTSYVVIPVFALANAGIAISASSLRDAAGSAVTLGIVLGLVVGKLVGVFAFASAAIRLGWARLPDDVRTAHLAGMACLAGIGFTVSLFITSLAFDAAPALEEEAKIGVLAASVIAAGIGALVLRTAGRRSDG